MLRYLSPSRAGPSRPRSDDPQLALHVPNYGVVFLPQPERAEDDDPTSEEVGDHKPRHDHMLHGELEVTLTAPKRAKAIRVGLRSTLKLDLGPGRRAEETILFERSVEILSSTADGVWLAAGTQRFDYTLILPSNLAPHDQHSNGIVYHDLYAVVEGLPSPDEWKIRSQGSSSSLFNLRGKRSPSAANSKSASRAVSPNRRGVNASRPASGASTPLTPGAPAHPAALSAALSNLAVSGNGTPSSTGATGGSGSGGAGTGVSTHSRPSPPHLSRTPSRLGSPTEPMSSAAAALLAPTPPPRLDRAPSYDDSQRPKEAANGEWLQGTFKAKRSVMLIYNPNPGDGANELHDRASGYVPGLGVWELVLVSDVWTICALLQIKVNLASLMPSTTVFAVRVLLAQTHSITSPRDPDAQKLTGTKHFVILEQGKRPPAGHLHPDKHYVALWRGQAAGGKDKADGESGGEIKIDTKARLPNDNVSRPSTLPGVVTPINVSHALVLEVFFSVYGEDDKGQPMKVPGPGGLRMLRVSRPVVLPSCALIPEVTMLPTYESIASDKEYLAPSRDAALPSGGPEWRICACGLKLEELESRMREAARDEQSPSLAGIAAAAAADDKAERERGRMRDRA
ncbi:hypothetical protein Q8F55_008939 [Vanrija albida]|uniref:Arrestin-like N-terminal domain-containing protein n=1 Tax=Vanrija albida TaxID=181172 RepID=A0ABR3PS92_9TREE